MDLKSTPQSGDEYWNLLKKTVEDSFTNVFPVSGRVNQIKLEKIEFKGDDKLHSHDFHSQEQAKHEEKTWGIPVYATLTLSNKETGEPINTARLKLATLPKMTPRWTYIVDGGEWQVIRQWRLKSGIYGVQKDNGAFQAEFNLGKRDSEGRIHPATFASEARLAIPFDPESKKFKFKYATTNTPLYSILRMHDVSDDEMKKEWGNDIFEANKSKNWEKDIMGFYNKLTRRGVKAPSNDFDSIKKTIIDEFHKAEVLPETTKLTLGKEYTNVNKGALIDASKHVLSIVRGEKKPDDVYSLEYKNLMSLEDFIREKFGTKKIQHSLKSKMRNTIDKKTRVADIVSSDVFNKQLKRVFVGHTLAQRPDQTNPLDILSNRGLTTIFGVGGLQNPQAVRDKMKIISHSHFGFLDTIHTPESCMSSECLVFSKLGWKNIDKITLQDEVACLIDSKLVFKNPIKLHEYDFDGILYGVKNKKIKYLVTPNHRIWHRSADQKSFRFKTAKDIYDNKPLIMKLQTRHQPYESKLVLDFQLPKVDITNKYLAERTKVEIDKPIDIELWAEFMGWFLSEGCTMSKENDYSVIITQVKAANPENCSSIEFLLNKLPWDWKIHNNKDYYIYNKQLAVYLKQFGDCYKKYIPEYFFEAPISARTKLLDSLMAGDGREGGKSRYPGYEGNEYEQHVYTTTSEQLANDVEKLMISLGYACSHKIYKDKRSEAYYPIHEVRLMKYWEHGAYKKKEDHYTENFKGKVYCLTVPGGLFYIKYKESSVAHWTGNSGTGINLHLPMGVRKIGNEPVTLAYDIEEKKHKYITPAEMHSEFTVLPDQIKYNENKVPVPLRDHVTVMDPKTHEFIEHPFNKCKYVLPSAKSLFDESTNLIPFLNANQGNRTMTGSKQPTQSIGLKYKEPPLVQVKSTTQDTFEKIIGNQFAHRSPIDATVHDIKKDNLGNAHTIQLKDQKGEVHDIPIYNNFALNDKKSFFHSTPIVKKGEQVTKGQIIGDVNHTVNGVLSMGTNLRVAYAPYHGETYEDGIAISESAAKKLTSEHLHKMSLEVDKDRDHVGLPKFLSYISSSGKKINKDSFGHLNNSGVIKPGTKVKPGDILIAGIRKNTLSGELAMVGAKMKGAINPYKDNSLVWDSDYEGEVVKVIEKPNDKGFMVYVKTLEPAQIGDKLCFDEETEILTNLGWKLIKDVTLDDMVGVVKNGELVYEQPEAIHHYPTGDKMYKVDTNNVSILVTENHNMWVKQESDFNFIQAKDILNKEVTMKRGCKWIGKSPKYFVFPKMEVRNGGRNKHAKRLLPEIKLPTKVFLAILGAYLSEGNLMNVAKDGNYAIEICQTKEPNRTEFTTFLKENNIKFVTNKQKIRIYSKQLMEYFKQFGHAKDKYIPNEVFSWAKEDLEILFKWLFWGDGHSADGEPIVYTTISKQLADDVQILALKIGYSSKVFMKKPERMEWVVKKWCLCKPLYNVYFYKSNEFKVNKILKTRKNIEDSIIEDYQKPVYCVTVPSHLLIMRRRGMMLIIGNSDRHGAKQIIGAIVPDHQMPRIGNDKGSHIELMINPVSIAGRINIGQMLETAAAKIAKKTGQPYVVDNFKAGQDITQRVKQDLEKNGISDTEKLWDPATKKYLTNEVLAGHKYLFKLKHQVEKKLSVRGMNDQTYTVDQAPKGGGGSGAQAVGQLEMYALLAHNARENLKEITNYKAERQHDPNMADTNYWNLIMQGSPLPPPKPTFAYKKFEAFLTGLGLNIKKEGYNYHLQPMTDKGVLAMSHGEIKEALAIRGKSDKEINKGIFSEKETGGLPNAPGKGLKWCFFEDTFIATDRGYLPIKQIVDLEMDVKILSQNKKTGELEWKKILNYWETAPEQDMLELELENEDGAEFSIYCTEGHKFYTKDGEDIAKNLQDKDILSLF